MQLRYLVNVLIHRLKRLVQQMKESALFMAIIFGINKEAVVKFNSVYNVILVLYWNTIPASLGYCKAFIASCVVSNKVLD